MLIPLPGGHFADPTTVAAVTCYGAEGNDDINIHLIHTCGGETSIGHVTSGDDQEAHCRRIMTEVAAAINAALAPKGVEEVADTLPADLRAVAVDALNTYLMAGHKEARRLASIQAKAAITLLESTPPKQAQPE